MGTDLTGTAAGGMPDVHEYASDWALVDVETSGLRPGRHRVLSVAVITVDAQGERTEEFSTLLDPGCDPGPVHIHGLTAERLRGAPQFEQVAERIGAMLEGRVMVAHNAQFDYGFLAHEFAQADSRLPVSRRLCTLALNRRLSPPTSDLRLGTLAAHYGVPQQRAHDALDDTRVLAGVLGASLSEAARLELPLPFVACPPRQTANFRPSAAKAPCAYRNPGRLLENGPLEQGMKVALTGSTETPRAELVARAVAGGLNVASAVSRHTSVLVTNDRSSGSAKARRAAAEGVPIVDERTFLRLLNEVRPGTEHDTAAAPAVRNAERVASSGEPLPGPAPAGPVPAEPAPYGAAHPEPVAVTAESEGPAPVPAAGLTVPIPRPPAMDQMKPGHKVSGKRGRGPLSGRRVLVLGGTHPEASAVRSRVVELGGAAAVNLSASVTDVMTLPGADRDRRLRRIVALEFPLRDADWLSAPVPDTPAEAAGRSSVAQVLPRGGVVDLPVTVDGSRWTITASWGQQTSCEVDVVAFTVDGDEQVSCDEDFIFYSAPESPDGAVRLSTDGPTEQSVTLDLAVLPAAARKAVVAAAIDGAATFGEVGAIEISVARGSSASPVAQATLDAATTERTLLLGEFYRRGASWRFRAVGQGYDHGLNTLAGGYGVDVEA